MKAQPGYQGEADLRKKGHVVNRAWKADDKDAPTLTELDAMLEYILKNGEMFFGSDTTDKGYTPVMDVHRLFVFGKALRAGGSNYAQSGFRKAMKLIERTSAVVVGAHKVTPPLTIRTHATSFLGAFDGSQHQNTHCDTVQNTKGNPKPGINAPMSILFALQPNTTVTVCTGSHIALEKFLTGKGAEVTLESVKWETVTLDAGEFCLFYGHTLHEGDAYKTPNIRAHAYLDSSLYKLEGNSTMPIARILDLVPFEYRDLAKRMFAH